jgi:hypothetical protein
MNRIHYLLQGCRIFLMSVLTVMPGIVLSQGAKVGSLEYLQRSNGFKYLTLGENVRQLPSYKLAYMDGDTIPDIDSCFKFEYKDEDIKELGNGLFLNLVGIRTCQNRIVNIYLFFKKEDGYNILRQFTANYGPFTDNPGDFMYDWVTSGVNLSLRYKPDLDLGVAVYTLNSLEDKLRERRLRSSSATIAQVGQ